LLQLQTTNASCQQSFVVRSCSAEPSQNSNPKVSLSYAWFGREDQIRLTIQSLSTATRGYGPVYTQVEMHESSQYRIRVIDIKGVRMSHNSKSHNQGKNSWSRDESLFVSEVKKL
jgi:hypothetical protein